MVPRLLSAFVLAMLAAAPVDAGQVLFATAAIANRVDSFCVRANGGLAPQPRGLQNTVNNPRRLLVAGDVLYVAGSTRVDAFKIASSGSLSRIGRTPNVANAGPRDITVDPARRMLYVPQRPQDRIAAYPLDAEGGFATDDFTTCVRGPFVSGFEDLELVEDRLYVSAEAGRGRVLVYPVAADGTLPEMADLPPDAEEGEIAECFRNDVETEPLSERRCIDGAGPLLLSDGILYVAARLRRRILSFELATDGLFTPAAPIGDGGCKKLEQQKPASRTKQIVRFIDLVRRDDTILGSSFEGGKVHAFPLQERDGRIIDLPKRSKRKTVSSFVRSPVRLTTAVSTDGRPTLYVGGGDLDRIEAYRLRETARGLLPGKRPFSKTDERRRTFPNDAVVVDAPDACNG